MITASPRHAMIKAALQPTTVIVAAIGALKKPWKGSGVESFLATSIAKNEDSHEINRKLSANIVEIF